jgi:hypothetical protein
VWNFLRPGQSGVRAVSDLDGLIQDLRTAENFLSSDPVIAANSYLIWAEKAEQFLLATFESLAVPRALQSDRYWRIRSTDTITSRPMPLIKAEIQIQKTTLEAIRSQLNHYISLLTSPPDGSIIVLDTNVYVHGRLVHEVDWHSEFGLPRVTVVVPLVVLDELDRIKDRDLEYGKRAASVLRAWDRLFIDDKWLVPKELRPRVTLQMVDEPPGHTRQAGQDDEIVRQAAYFAQINENRLMIVTRDRGMRLRARAHGLASRALPSHLERIPASNNG